MDAIFEPTYRTFGLIYDLYDGDTIYYHALLPYKQAAVFQTGRLLDIDTPEIRPLRSREAATRSKEYLWRLIQQYSLNKDSDSKRVGHKLLIQSEKADNKWFTDIPMESRGKFGRWLVTLIGADSYGNPVNLNRLMLLSGLAAKPNY